MVSRVLLGRGCGILKKEVENRNLHQKLPLEVYFRSETPDNSHEPWRRRFVQISDWQTLKPFFDKCYTLESRDFWLICRPDRGLSFKKNLSAPSAPGRQETQLSEKFWHSKSGVHFVQTRAKMQRLITGDWKFGLLFSLSMRIEWVFSHEDRLFGWRAAGQFPCGGANSWKSRFSPPGFTNGPISRERGRVFTNGKQRTTSLEYAHLLRQSHFFCFTSQSSTSSDSDS